MLSIRKYLNNYFSKFDHLSRSTKLTVIASVIVFASIPLTVFALYTVRSFDSKAAVGRATLTSPFNGAYINTNGRTFDWNCYCYTTRYRLYLKEGNGIFYSGTWYKDVGITSSSKGTSYVRAPMSSTGWQSVSYPAFNGFQSGKRYYWAVGCTPGYGSCNVSPTYSFVVDNVPPTAPFLSLDGIINPPYVSLRWTSSSDNLGSIRYVVYRAISGTNNFVLACESLGTTCADSNWEGKLSYTYRAQAVDVANNYSSYSNFLQVTTPDRDFDLDGFLDSVERHVGTNVRVRCGANAWPPDFNGDGKVDITDQQTLAYNFGSSNKRYDLNADGAVNSIDLQIAASYSGKVC